MATGVKDAAERLRTAATTWYAEQERLVAQMGPGMTGAEVSAHYAVALEDVRADLQKTFAARPLGGLGADGKKEKPEAWKSQLYEDVSMILDAVEDAIVEVQRILDAPEAQTRASFGAVKPFLRTVMVLAGAYLLRIIVSSDMHIANCFLSGKFAHEHPLFFDKVILPILMTMLMPFVPKIVAFILLNIFLSILEAQRPIPAGA